ncbi:MAG: peptidase S51 [Rubrivivax sp.]|nr:peptidase S51 [Pyrinomonadaceae bacterium]
MRLPSRPAVRLLSFLLFLLLAPAAAQAKVTRYLTGSAADVKPRLHGPSLDLGGGGTDVAEAIQQMIDEVRGCNECATSVDVVVLRASGADGYNDYIKAMRGVDSVETLVITSPEDARDAALVETIRGAEVVFFAGGDQCNYVKNFKGNAVEAAVEAVYARGGGIGGTSAGEAIQGEFVYDACDTDGATSAQALADPYDASVRFTYDFFRWRYMNGVITDQHLVTRQRLGRTLVFVARQLKDRKVSKVLAVAVNEKTSVVVDKRGTARVMGEGPAYFILGDHAPEVCEPKKPLTFSNFKIWKVAANGTFDLKRRPKVGFYLVSVKDGQLGSNPY